MTANNNADVDITWTAPSGNGGESIDSYAVYIKNNLGSFVALSSCSAQATTSCTVTLDVLKSATFNLALADVVKATVTATNDVGTTAQSTEGGLATIQLVPSTPSALTTTNSGPDVTFTWTEAANNGNDVNSFEVFIKP